MPIASFSYLTGSSSHCNNVMYLYHSMDASCTPVNCGTSGWSFPDSTKQACPSDWKAYGRSVFQAQNIEFVEIGRYQDTACTVPWASGEIGEHYATNKCTPVQFGAVSYYLVTVSNNQKQVTWSTFSTSDCSGTPTAISFFNVGGCTSNPPGHFQQSVTLFTVSSPPQPPTSPSPLPPVQQSPASPPQSTSSPANSVETSLATTSAAGSQVTTVNGPSNPLAPSATTAASQQPNGTSSGGPNGAVIGGAVAAILVIGLTIGAFVYSRRRKSDNGFAKNSSHPLTTVYTGNNQPPSYEPTDSVSVHSGADKVVHDSALPRFPENPPAFTPPKPIYSVTAVPGFYRATSDYVAENDAQLTLKEGQRLYITSLPNADGWCKGLVGKGEGWVHASLLGVFG
ncbi:UNVERIFIED_CONTAM: hypothetical protein HDU68_012932 [Siphonaria sp. JEL0065]|nr:hypothetical protein HDU68_012932 [Siphonaria sp. JEL0065]